MHDIIIKPPSSPPHTGVSVVTAAAPGAVGLVSHPPTEGKFLGMQPRALQASSERYIPGTVLET